MQRDPENLFELSTDLPDLDGVPLLHHLEVLDVPQTLGQLGLEPSVQNGQCPVEPFVAQVSLLDDDVALFAEHPGHGVGRSLHEDPREIANYCDSFNTTRFKKHSVVAIETFISTKSSHGP